MAAGAGGPPFEHGSHQKQVSWILARLPTPSSSWGGQKEAVGRGPGAWTPHWACLLEEGEAYQAQGRQDPPAPDGEGSQVGAEGMPTWETACDCHALGDGHHSSDCWCDT